ncbi:Rhamnulose-1-phosphate aldolase [Tritrichomonas foetus]|uniref:Rhamnulose-1-phosphate aldolase n=1 Tax=Tritrichomonas foetus TaxID=1144522 RepID=A0A1J4KLA0_9EUKA|nr:Rhamnulose-1-phosphate aldolase [Tritrichomonas foetus]|eukprot:OHT10149.1 Rhamnulose-1-phosphate aldolase [Tritrichomonas foetus]
MTTSVLTGRPELEKAVLAVAEVAGYLWQKGWAERNGGNITLNITEYVDDEIRKLPALCDARPIGDTLPHLKGCFFYCKGTNKRMRDLARFPMDHGSIIRICDDCSNYEIIADKPVIPTSEIVSHLSFHNHFLEVGNGYKAVVHTHPIDLVALSHNEKFLEKDVLTRLLWSMIPETRAFCPKGLGICRYQLPSSKALAEATLAQLDEYDVVLWEKHGVVSVSADVGEAFDMIDTLSKSAQIYLNAKTIGFEPDGMTNEQMNEMKVAFKLPGKTL